MTKTEARRQYERDWREKNKERVKLTQADWRRRNPRKVKASQQRSYHKNREKVLARQKAAGPKRSRATTVLSRARYKLYSINRRCRTNGWPETDVTAEWLESLWVAQKGQCDICAVEMKTRSVEDNDPTLWSVDRIDSKLPYNKNNVALICFRCNSIKGEGSADDHQRIAIWLREKTRREP